MNAPTVLMIDRESEDPIPVEQQLLNRGIDIRSVRSEADALFKIGKKEIDIVLLDIMIPETDSMDLLKQIKTIDPLVEIILLAGQAEMSLAIQGLEQGAFDILLKPMDTDDLIYTIRDAYNKKLLSEQKIETLIDRK